MKSGYGTSNFGPVPERESLLNFELFFQFQKKVFVYYCAKFGFQKSPKMEEFQRFLKIRKFHSEYLFAIFEILEKFRIKTRKFARLKKIINGPKSPEPSIEIPSHSGRVFCLLTFSARARQICKDRSRSRSPLASEF